MYLSYFESIIILTERGSVGILALSAHTTCLIISNSLYNNNMPKHIMLNIMPYK